MLKLNMPQTVKMGCYPALLKFAALLLIFQCRYAESLQVGFYSKSCPDAEQIIRSVVQKWFVKDKSIPAGLLRLHFHDCFIGGCDASVLVDSTEGNAAEKDAVPNLTLRGFDLIDDIKSAIEARCPGTVSCSDVLTIATRDAVFLSGGPDYAVPTGRRDGTVSKIDEVSLPGPTFSISAALNAFNAVGLDLVDLATLLGAHTIGFAHCGFFNDRLYDFEGTGQPDSTMNKKMVQALKKRCPPPNVIDDIRKDPKVFLDRSNGSSFVFDSNYYKQLLKNQALLQIDQELLFTDVTSELAVQYANDESKFHSAFSRSITKMGAIRVLEGSQGQIRTNCRRIL